MRMTGRSLSVILVLHLSLSAYTKIINSLPTGSNLHRSVQRHIPSLRPLNIAHRGASGILPEHTIEAYKQAISDGADFIECDVTLTLDLVPVCLHENSLRRTTDVEEREEFAYKRHNLTLPVVGGAYDWFAIDFTWEELKQLRKKQAEEYRDQKFNGEFRIPSFEEFMDFAHEHGVGIYPELKDPVWLNTLPIMNGSLFEDIFLDIVNSHGYTDENSPCIIQSFSELSLQYLANKTTIRLGMLISRDATNAELDKWKSWGIDGLGVSTTAISKYQTLLNGYKNWITETTDLVERAHERGLTVHIWTMRNEDRYLAWDWQQDIHLFIDHFLKLGVDGIFTDFPGTLTRYLDLLYSSDQTNSAVNLECIMWIPLLVFSVLYKLIFYNDKP